MVTAGFLKKLNKLIRANYLALLFAAAVGLIYLAPYFIFSASLGDKYRGIPMIATANEDVYLARIQEIIDGHPLVGSVAFYEEKDQPPLIMPTVEMIYALPSLLFGVPLLKTLIASKFVLPFILFLLVYFLINKITAKSYLLSNKINAIAGALLVTLGYDLVDYRSIWLYLTGKIVLGDNFLIWARPVNPVAGAIFLFSFLICLWLIIQRSPARKKAIWLAALFLALMIASYFFSWGAAVSVLAIITLIYMLRREFGAVKDFIRLTLAAVALAAPYWFISFRAGQSPWHRGALLRNGLFQTHYPIFNKFLLASLLFYLAIVACSFIFKKEKIKFIAKIENWHLFTLALLLGGLWALNQQIITGLTVWPYHFVQYTIPLSMVVFSALLYNIVKAWKPFVWVLAISVIASSSLIFGLIIQTNSYLTNYNRYVALQSYKPIFDWLNQQEKDSVVLVKIDDTVKFELVSGLIPAFTHDNVYAFHWAYYSLKPDRIYDSFLTILRSKGVSPDKVEDYLRDNQGDANLYLCSNWKGLFSVKDFPDFSDTILAERLKSFPGEYREFTGWDFRTELKKYRLDYILSDSPLTETFSQELGTLELAFYSNGFYIYNFD